MSNPTPAIRINVDVTNPGQFFACCGLLELADRLWPGAEGWFDRQSFCINTSCDLADLMQAVTSADLFQLDSNDDTSSAMELNLPSGALRLDWWHDGLSGGKELKVWAGRMGSVRIARAMQNALKDRRFYGPELLNVGQIVYDPNDPDNKVEPFYFDARRGPNAHSRDIGFSPDSLELTTTAFPAVEFLCLIGLQRCLPSKTHQPRVYDYSSWSCPILPNLLRPIVAGKVPISDSRCYRFENWYRTGQKKHKAFRSAIPIKQGGE